MDRISQFGLSRNPIASDVMDFQIQLARRESTALEFVPSAFRGKA